MQQETGKAVQSRVKVIWAHLCTQLQVEPKGCYDYGASHSSCCATWWAPIFKCFQFLCNYYFCAFPLRGQSITIQPATTQISISSCGDDKTISLLFQFSKYSNRIIAYALPSWKSCLSVAYVHDAVADYTHSAVSIYGHISRAILIFLHKHRKQINMLLRRTQWNLYMQW